MSLLDRLLWTVIGGAGWLARRVSRRPGHGPGGLDAAGAGWQPGGVPVVPDLLTRWARHASRMSSSDLLVATYVHTRITEETMADLRQAVADLQAAVNRVLAGIGPNASALQEALRQSQAAQDQLREQLARAQSEDVAEDADFQARIDDLTAQLDAANAAANDAAGALVAATGQLDQLATAAEQQPVTTPPTDEAGNPLPGQEVPAEEPPVVPVELPPTQPGDPNLPMGEPIDPTGGEGTPVEPPAETPPAETPPADATDTGTTPEPVPEPEPPVEAPPADVPPATDQVPTDEAGNPLPGYAPPEEGQPVTG